jgi:hypothetical protein
MEGIEVGLIVGAEEGGFDGIFVGAGVGFVGK